MNCCICKKIINNSIYNFCFETCLDDYCFLSEDNYLINKYKQNHLVFELLVNTAISCINSPKSDKIFYPSPSKLSISQIKSNLPINFSKNLHNYFSSFRADKDIISNFSLQFYYFLKYIIITTNTNLIPTKLKDNSNLFLDEESKNIYEGNIQFDVIHNPAKESEFKNIDLYYLFHGSSSGNWYSILRNGLKNYSNTNLMTNGAVHGSGIYLSDSLNFARGYSGKFHNSDEIFMVGVCQLKNDTTQYLKTKNIYTVQNENDLILRHIIILNNLNKNVESIEKYYTIDLKKEYAFSKNNIFKINNKRLVKEIEYIEKFSKKHNYNIIVESKLNPILQLNVNIFIEKLNKNIIINFTYINICKSYKYLYVF